MEYKLKDGTVFTIREAEVTDTATILEFVNQCAGETDYFTFGSGEGVKGLLGHLLKHCIPGQKRMAYQR